MRKTESGLSYNPQKQTGKREHIKAIRDKNPCATLQEIADHVGLSRERVRQILKSEGKPTRHYQTPEPTYACLNCGKISSKTFCSKKCRYNYCNPQVECSECHKLFRVSKSVLMNRLSYPKRNRKVSEIFCSKVCYGKWWGRHFGTKKKYDHELIQLFYNQGESYKSICTRIGISQPYLEKLITLFANQGKISLRRDGKRLTSRTSHDKTLPIAHIRVRWLKHLNLTDREIITITHCGKATIFRASSR